MTGAYIADIRRCADIDQGHSTLWRLFVHSYGLQALLAYRLGRWLLRAGRRFYLWPLLPIGWPVYYLLSRYARVVYSIRLEMSADIGPGFYIGHFGGIQVRHCHIGVHCSIGRLTDIGAAADGAGPAIGDRVWIGSHTQIIGPYRIGSGATVGAGTVVRHDVPERVLCLGNPLRLVMRNYDNRRILGLKDRGEKPIGEVTVA
jgi:serine O-acetyltransferase